MSKEAQARIKINQLLEAAGWRFFDTAAGNANIGLEHNVKLTQLQVDALGNDFETTSQGYIDFLLLDDRGFPLVVLEAKAGRTISRLPMSNHSVRKNSICSSRNCEGGSAERRLSGRPSRAGDSHTTPRNPKPNRG